MSKTKQVKEIATDEAIKKYLEVYFLSGEVLNSETLKRYMTVARRRFPEWLEYMNTIKELRKKFTPEELKQLAKTDRIVPTKEKVISFEGDTYRFAHITDTHFGASCFKEDTWNAIVKEINSQNLDAVFHTGDITDGLSTRRMDAVYDLTHIGYKQQKDYSIELLSQISPPIYAIGGNHDRFYLKSAGALIAEDIAKEVEGMHYLGEDMADFVIQGKDREIRIRLWHGEDGSSYATSYRVQKLVESFSGGDKPNVLLCGHTHKQIFMFDRNIECLSGGAVCYQSNWMRSKRLANHTGFWIAEMTFNEGGIVKFSPTWYPFY